MPSRRAAVIAAAGALVAVVGCAEPLVPVGEDETLLEQAGDYTQWVRPNNRDGRAPTAAPHGAFADIFINDVVEADLAMTMLPEGLPEWSEGAMVVIEGWDAMADGELVQVAIMHKRHGQWEWEQYDGGSSVPRFSGRPDVCRGCHGAGEDFTRSLRLPDAPKK